MDVEKSSSFHVPLPKVAIVCDWLVARGGAERCIGAIAELYPEAPIFTSIYSPAVLPEFAGHKVVTSFLQHVPFSKKMHHFFLPLMPYVFEQFDLSAYDIVISSSHSCAKGIITKPRTLHISYCHSPMRYCWDSCHSYFEQFGIPRILKMPARWMLHRLRVWDRLSADRVDFFIANSLHVADRIKKYYRKSSDVIYPPVETRKFTIAPEGTMTGQYYVAVGRLTPYKRFDIVIDAFNALKLPLVIVGTGKQERELKSKAGRFITFVGKISDAELNNIYQKAKALIFPQTEDFGITPLEAMSCGVPVIAYAQGGALETIVDGKTGLFFHQQNAKSLQEAVLALDAITWDPQAIRTHAESFDKVRFTSALKKYVQDKWTLWKETMVGGESKLIPIRNHQPLSAQSVDSKSAGAKISHRK